MMYLVIDSAENELSQTREDSEKGLTSDLDLMQGVENADVFLVRYNEARSCFEQAEVELQYDDGDEPESAEITSWSTI